jgi:hypothetical protein
MKYFSHLFVLTIVLSTALATSQLAHAGSGSMHKLTFENGPKGAELEVFFTAAGCAETKSKCGHENTEIQYICAQRSKVKVGDTVAYRFLAGSTNRKTIVCPATNNISVPGSAKRTLTSKNKHAHLCSYGRNIFMSDNAACTK